MLAVNAWDEDEATLRRFVKRGELEHRILVEGSGTYAEYGKAGVPYTLWIKPDGTIADLQLGFNGPGGLEKRTARLLAAGG